MLTLTTLALAFLPLVQDTRPADTWDSLTSEHKHALEEWFEWTSRDPSLELPLPGPEFQERFLALAEGGARPRPIWRAWRRS